jgi:hypothetical protein
MNKVSHRSAPKAEPKPHSIDPKAVSQIGLQTFLGRDALRDGKGYATPQGPRTTLLLLALVAVAQFTRAEVKASTEHPT